MMKRMVIRVFVYFLSFAVFIGGVGYAGLIHTQKDYWFSGHDKVFPSEKAIKVPEYNPNKPTVAVILGNVTTEVFDFLFPYDMFAMTNEFNVFAVASDHNVKRITGGLEVIPHYSFSELDQMLGKSPDIIVIPHLPSTNKEDNRSVREWLLKHSETTLLSICGGSETLADTGLLRGKSAATHWEFIDSMMKLHPEVNWVRNQRYVQDGNIVSSAGLTSGIDAVLHVISQKIGEPEAAKLAKDLNYPTYQFVQNPKVEPYYLDWKYSIYLFNVSFQWNKNKTGVLLYNGMDDGALASIIDTYADTGTTKIFTVSSSSQPIVTKHNLNLLARYQIANAPKLDKMIVSGTEAKSLAAPEVKQWIERDNVKPSFLQSDSPDRFMFEPAIEDLSKQEDVLTAKHDIKRLEYRGNGVKLEGKPFSFETYGNLLLLAAISVLVALFLDRRFIRKKQTSRQKHVQAAT
jgi:AraC family transcriptional activator FtrA